MKIYLPDIPSDQNKLFEELISELAVAAMEEDTDKLTRSLADIEDRYKLFSNIPSFRFRSAGKDVELIHDLVVMMQNINKESAEHPVSHELSKKLSNNVYCYITSLLTLDDFAAVYPEDENSLLNAKQKQLLNRMDQLDNIASEGERTVRKTDGKQFTVISSLDSSSTVGNGSFSRLEDLIPWLMDDADSRMNWYN